MLNEQRLFGNLSDAQQNSVAMQGTEGNRFQDEKVESTGKKLSLVGHDFS